MENKKISFGFSKINKKTEIFSKQPKKEKSVELIDCLEGKSIKLKDPKQEDHKPLIIPVQDSTENLINRVKKAAEKRIKQEAADEKPDSELTIEELAARQLIREAKNRNNQTEDVQKIYELPLKDDKFVNEGKEESTLDDYENIPISDYGMAMLRGMGWKEGTTLGKNPSKKVAASVPDLRPKGLGLGANKSVNQNKPKPAVDKNGKELQLVKNAFVKIIAGTHKDHYGQIQGFDDENCRVILKVASTNQVITLNEFLLVTVTETEYASSTNKTNSNFMKREPEECASELKDEKTKGREKELNNEKLNRFKKSSETERKYSPEAETSSCSKRRDDNYKSQSRNKSKHREDLDYRSRDKSHRRDRSSDRKSKSDKSSRDSSRKSNYEKTKKHKKKSKKHHKRYSSSGSDSTD